MIEKLENLPATENESNSGIGTDIPKLTTVIDGSNSEEKAEDSNAGDWQIGLLILLIPIIAGAIYAAYDGYKKYYLKKDPEDDSEKNDGNQVELEMK